MNKEKLYAMLGEEVIKKLHGSYFDDLLEVAKKHADGDLVDILVSLRLITNNVHSRLNAPVKASEWRKVLSVSLISNYRLEVIIEGRERPTILDADFSVKPGDMARVRYGKLEVRNDSKNS